MKDKDGGWMGKGGNYLYDLDNTSLLEEEEDDKGVVAPFGFVVSCVLPSLVKEEKEDKRIGGTTER
jgi:hypothetical protein